MGIGAGDTYFKPLEEIGSRLSKDRALTLFETSERIRWLYGKIDFNGDRNVSISSNEKEKCSEFTAAKLPSVLHEAVNRKPSSRRPT